MRGSGDREAITNRELAESSSKVLTMTAAMHG
jgi:hypothetical protein